MVFSSLVFLFGFLPIVLTSYFLVRSIFWRNIVLVVFSLIFYAWGEPIWVCLLLVSGVVDYLSGLWIEHHRGRRIAVLGLVATLVINLGMLISFKYSDFIVANVNALTGLQFSQPGLLLPVGISFYTFETISYTIDVYRGDAKAQRSFLKYMAFIASFPRLVAGPIIRYGHVEPQIEARSFDLDNFTGGMYRFCRGLFKKVFIANVAGELCVQFMGVSPMEATLGGSWFGLLMFTLQIYFDFSGYSDMAIGLGRVFGFTYPENFRHPYTATSITDFWRRWHITLGNFFRDYVYIPLGGNRSHALRNILVVWALTGIWHGASWNFGIWGLYFGLILIFEKYVFNRVLEAAPLVLRHIYALFFIIVGWALFYFVELDKLIAFLGVLFGLTPRPLSDFALVSALSANAFWLMLALALCMPVRARVQAALEARMEPLLYAWTDLCFHLMLLALAVALLVGSSYNPFIYFRF